MKAEQFLRNGADVLAERGKEYDKPEGERSMQRCVSAFEIITGKRITESEGWLFMQILKDVRQWQNPERYHEDSAVDCVNYAALKAEALSEQKPVATVEDLMLGGDTLNQRKNGKPDWKDAPDFANWLGYDHVWTWFEKKPKVTESGTLNGYGWCQSAGIRDSFGYSIHYMEPRP